MSTDELLLRMRAVLWDGHLQRWDARVKNCEQYGHGATPREAMEDAMRLYEDEL